VDRPVWLADVQRPRRAVPASADRPGPLLFDAEHRPIATREGWNRRRIELGDTWSAFIGRIPAPRAAPRAHVLEEDRLLGVIRQLVRYESEPGLPVEAYLLRPAAPGQDRPGVVVLHSTVSYTIRQPAGLEGPDDLHIGLHLARRGYVAVCPRCFLWQYAPEGKPLEAVQWLKSRHPDVKGMAKMVFDAIRAVDLLAAQPDVAAGRLGTIGHSLGAKEALYLAGFDPRIRATVSSEGGIGLGYSNWDAPWYLRDDIKKPAFELNHAQVLALAAPNAFLLVGGESADGDRSWPYIEATLPVWALAGSPEAVGLLNHRQGHALPTEPRERAYEWLDWFLRPPPRGG
jgi:dienelactone hydrolase